MNKLKRTRLIILILIALLLLGLAASARSIEEYYIKSQLDPQIELQTSIKNMTTVDSYRYKLTSCFTVAERKEVISRVEGEKSGANTHIKGEMVNTAVDIYYIDRTIYNYDAFSKKWLIIESDTNKSEELLISELNPLSNFRFKLLKYLHPDKDFRWVARSLKYGDEYGWIDYKELKKERAKSRRAKKNGK